MMYKINSAIDKGKQLHFLKNIDDGLYIININAVLSEKI